MADGFPPFAFTDEVSIGRRDYTGSIPAGIRDRNALFDALARELQFPSYFGKNWDALDECLSCLSEWIPQERIVLMHNAAPHLSRREMVIYISILRDAIICLRAPQDHDDPVMFSARELIVAFPRSAAKRIAEAWAGVKPSLYS